MRKIKLNLIDKKASGDVIWQTITLVIVAIFIALIIYGLISGQLQPLIKKVGTFFDMVLVQLNIKKVEIPNDLVTQKVTIPNVGTGTFSFDVDNLECTLEMEATQESYASKFRFNLQKGYVEIGVGVGDLCDSDRDKWCKLGIIDNIDERETARKLFNSLVYEKDHLFIDIEDQSANSYDPSIGLLDLHFDNEGCLWVRINSVISGEYIDVSIDSSANLYKRSEKETKFTKVSDSDFADPHAIAGKHRWYNYTEVFNLLDMALINSDVNPAARFNWIKIKDSDDEFPPQFSCIPGEEAIFYINAETWGYKKYYGVSNEIVNGKPVYYIGEVKEGIVVWKEIDKDVKNWKKLSYTTPDIYKDTFETEVDRYYFLEDDDPQLKLFTSEIAIKEFMEQKCR